LKNSPIPGGGGDQQVLFGGENWERKEKIVENVTKKEEWGKKKNGSKRVKEMKNREELRWKGHDGAYPGNYMGQEEENILFSVRGQGNKNHFWTKIYTPDLSFSQDDTSHICYDLFTVFFHLWLFM
jgi:hypothetical protein